MLLNMNFDSISREKIIRNGFPPPIELTKEIIQKLSSEQTEVLADIVDYLEKIAFSSTLNLRPKTIKEKEAVFKREITYRLSIALTLGLGYLEIIQTQCRKYNIT